jgi:hypothetical protein
MKRLEVLSAAAALLFVATAAQAQRGQDDRHGRQDQHQDQRQEQQHPRQEQQHQQAAPQAQPSQGGAWRGGEAQQGGNDRAREEQARADQARAAAEQNQRRAAQQNDQWRAQQNGQAQHQAQLERERQAQQQAEQLEREREVQANRAYDRTRDVQLLNAYRYNIRGVYRETNQFGADVLRQAVDQGYDQGYRAGLNDHRDGVGADFQRALNFESGGFGYTGGYVPADDYSYYFSQGFQRGYDDGYWNRSDYGTFSNGNAAILGAVALGILGLTMVH